MNLKYLFLSFLILIVMSCSNQDIDLEEEYTPVPFSLEIPEIFQKN